MNDLIAIEKADLRKKLSSLRGQIAAEEKGNRDLRIAEYFLESKLYRNARAILAYISVKNEVDTIRIIRQILLDGKALAVPVCVPNDCSLLFYRIQNLSELLPAPFGLLEPDTARSEPVDVGSYPICIVPALAYDKKGCRIGYGRGYYDRFLASYTGCAVGLCYDSFLLDSLPADRYDRPVQMLITESGCRLFGEN
jgi:5-formyltetrahydrofolate cyclo-ligase